MMTNKKGGVIFHVGSIVNESIGSISYNAAKTALSSYVRTLSKNLSNKKISVTGINPGAFEYKNNAMDRLKKTIVQLIKILLITEYHQKNA